MMRRSERRALSRCAFWFKVAQIHAAPRGGRAAPREGHPSLQGARHGGVIGMGWGGGL